MIPFRFERSSPFFRFSLPLTALSSLLSVPNWDTVSAVRLPFGINVSSRKKKNALMHLPEQQPVVGSTRLGQNYADETDSASE